MKKLFYLLGMVTVASLLFTSCEKQADIIEPQGETIMKGTTCEIYVPGDYATIQEAIDNATDDCIIFVDEGTYYEQIEIRDLDDLKLKGDDAIITVPTGGMTGQLVKFYNCQNFTFTGFIVDGAEGVGVSYGSRNSGGDTDTRFCGIFTINSSGVIKSNEIINVSWHNGVQQGLGVYALVDDGVERNIEIKDNNVDNFQKGGIVVVGDIDSKIMNNTITHWCEIGIIAGNGIQVYGGSTMVQKNDVSCSLYYDEILYPNWVAAGLLLFPTSPNKEYKIINNDLSYSDVGAYILDYTPDGDANVKVINNKFSNNVWDLYIWPNDDGMKVHANKYE